MNYNDIELVLLLAVMAVLFLVGLRKRKTAVVDKFTGVDLPMSQALMGIACVLILMGHYAARLMYMSEATTVSMMVYRTTANVALSIFMFFSGYGLSVKKPTGGGILRYGFSESKRYICHYYLFAS